MTPPRLATGRFFADLGRPRSNQKFRRTPLDTDTDYLRSVNFPKARAINGLKDKLAVVALLDGRLHGHCQDCSAVLIRVTDHLERGREQSKCGDLAARSQGTGKIFTVPEPSHWENLHCSAPVGRCRLRFFLSFRAPRLGARRRQRARAAARQIRGVVGKHTL